MRRLSVGLLTLLLAAPAAWALDETKDKDKAEKKPATPKEEYQALIKEYQGKQQEFSKAYGAAKTNEERQKVIQEKYPKPQEFAARFLKLADGNAKDDVGFDAALWLVQNVRGGAEMDKGLKILMANHLENPKIGQVCLSLVYSQSGEAEKFLRDVMEKNSTKEAQGLACYALASSLKNRGDPNKESEGLFERAADKYADVKAYGNRTIGVLAKGELFEIRNLAIGKTAPDIEGEDLDGKKFKLSDYRGKVVVLDFWGHW